VLFRSRYQRGCAGAFPNGRAADRVESATGKRSNVMVATPTGCGGVAGLAGQRDQLVAQGQGCQGFS